ncbi:MAG: hypothetical protein U0R71_15045 [Solirubrobacterales bacterium]
MAPGAESVRAALDPFRARLPEHARDYTVALLALAKANAVGGAEFNAPSPQDALALQALLHWRREAHRALRRVRATAGGAHTGRIAERWLKTMIAALDLERQSLSIADPAQAARAAASARRQVSRYHRLEAELERALA